MANPKTYKLEVFETATQDLVWELESDNMEDIQNEMDSWDVTEYEFNLEEA